MTKHAGRAIPLRRSYLAAVIWLSTAGAGLSQPLGQGRGTGLSWWRVLGALVLCLGLAVLGALALKVRLQGQIGPLSRPKLGLGLLRGIKIFDRPAQRLKHVESLRLSPQLEVSLFSCDDREFLIAAAAGGVIIVREGPVPTNRGEDV